MKLCIGLSIILLLAAVGGLLWEYRAPGPAMADTQVIIPARSNVAFIAQTLEEQHVIRSALRFKALLLVSGKKSQLKAGEYLFPAQSSVEAVIERMAEGKIVVHQITIPEGLTGKDVQLLLQQQTLLTGETGDIAEGRVLPETYQFIYGDSRQKLIERMQALLQKTLQSAWEKRQLELPLRTPQEALILASIVEKETGVADERPRVAAVFINRLKRGMKLQSDPTAAYGVAQLQGVAIKPPTSADVQTPSPYNTYVIDGLPPGPIANPGKASIEAVLHPAVSNDLYFVATGNGGHYFAETLEQHNENVRRYREVLRARYSVSK